METAAIIELISTLGFPIACVIAMAFFIYKIYKRSETREDELRNEIRENQAINAEAIKTLALYAERLDTIQNDVETIKEDIAIIMTK